jgi:hypothetical protein
MVEIDEIIGGEYINAELVRNAKDKRCVIINEGEIIETKFGRKALELKVQIDTFTKTWTLNQETMRNLREQWGSNSKEWVGKMVMLSTAEREGKRYVVGFPI